MTIALPYLLVRHEGSLVLIDQESAVQLQEQSPPDITWADRKGVTYDHRHRKIRDPVRSPIDKPVIARLVLGWVTTGESLVLYVFCLASFCSFNLFQDKLWYQSKTNY
jgi:hypothetical protein